jgi:subtilisin family serine protease
MKNKITSIGLFLLIIIMLIGCSRTVLQECYDSNWDDFHSAILKSYPNRVEHDDPVRLSQNNEKRDTAMIINHYIRYQYIVDERVQVDQLPEKIRQFIKDSEICPCDPNIQLITLDGDLIQKQSDPKTSEKEVEDALADIQGGDRPDRNFVHYNKTRIQSMAKHSYFDLLTADLIDYKPGRDDPDKVITIAVLDSGVDFFMSRKKSKLIKTWHNPAPGSCGLNDDFIGWDFVNDDNSPLDDQGHGTAVASVITKEMARKELNYRIMPVKVLNHMGVGTTFDISCGMAYAYKNKADIINCSFGYFGKESPTLAYAIKEAQNESILTLAMGNYQQNIMTNAFYPARFPFQSSMKKVISVMGHSSTTDSKLWNCTNYADVIPSKVASQGEDVEVLVPAYLNSALPSLTSAVFNDPPTKVFADGTSFATPIVSAIAAYHLANSVPSEDVKATISSAGSLEAQLINQNPGLINVKYTAADRP